MVTGAVTMAALQAQLNSNERAPAALMRQQQQQQIEALAAHAHAHSPFWRARLDAAAYGRDAHWFDTLPILTRVEAKAAGKDLFALPVPSSHGKVGYVKTSGSTGTPLIVAKTDLALVYWRASMLRDALWHQRDLRGTLASIRVGAERKRLANWGRGYEEYSTGPALLFDAREDVGAQLDWLLSEKPNILLTHPSNLYALAKLSLQRQVILSSLREVRTYSESLPADLRDLVRNAWNVPLNDIYSANEVGYIALQCPQTSGYHVLSEDVLVEIVDETGMPCGVGESGRVIVTSLHNFATPLLRYDLGDYATVGAPCRCGRTLPTLDQLLGRTRNMLRLPQGRLAWPGFPMNTLVALQAIQELRMIQHSLSDLEIELVLSRPLTDEESTRLVNAVRTRLQHPFDVRLTPVARIPRGPNAKREDFECRMS